MLRSTSPFLLKAYVLPADDKHMNLKFYFSLCAIEALFALIALASIPSSQGHAIFLGFSSARLVMLAFLVVVSLVFLACGYQSFRDPARSASQEDKGINWLASQNLTVIRASIFLVSFVCLLIVFLGLWPISFAYKAYFLRLVPIAALVVLVGLQSLLFIAGPFKKPNIDVNELGERIRTSIRNGWFDIRQTMTRAIGAPSVGFWASMLIAIPQIGRAFSKTLATGLQPDAQTYLQIVDQMRFLYDTNLREPVWIWLVSVGQLIFGEGDVGLILSGVVIFILTGLLVHKLALAIFDNRLFAFASTFLFFTNPLLIDLAVAGLRDNLFTFGVIGVTFIAFSPKEQLPIGRRIFGATIFLLLASGTRLTSIFPLGLVLTYGFVRSEIKLRYVFIPLCFVALILTPYLIYSWQTWGDPMYSVNIHAVWWRNYEFVTLRGTGCAGCATPEQVRTSNYSGEYTSVFNYYFGLHSLGQIIKGTFDGFVEIFLKPSGLFFELLGKTGWFWFIMYYLGLTFLFVTGRWLFLGVPILVTNLLAYTVGIGMPYRLFSASSPFLVVTTAFGIVYLLQIIQSRILPKGIG